ncbi:hypothetical protein Salat_0022200 [Sesamum alatum]|uniref:Uncharacterized protein n=1 Tax=Sesamum alatum TaxID=300844 RepID=A0AAE1YVM6_9LAMI|nr:hypothetical protein Salat_0022200 [Sesamum alatum]
MQTLQTLSFFTTFLPLPSKPLLKPQQSPTNSISQANPLNHIFPVSPPTPPTSTRSETMTHFSHPSVPRRKSLKRKLEGAIGLKGDGLRGKKFLLRKPILLGSLSMKVKKCPFNPLKQLRLSEC